MIKKNGVSGKTIEIIPCLFLGGRDFVVFPQRVLGPFLLTMGRVCCIINFLPKHRDLDEHQSYNYNDPDWTSSKELKS